MKNKTVKLGTVMSSLDRVVDDTYPTLDYYNHRFLNQNIYFDFFDAEIYYLKMKEGEAIAYRYDGPLEYIHHIMLPLVAGKPLYTVDQIDQLMAAIKDINLHVPTGTSVYSFLWHSRDEIFEEILVVAENFFDREEGKGPELIDWESLTLDADADFYKELKIYLEENKDHQDHQELMNDFCGYYVTHLPDLSEIMEEIKNNEQ
jgi:hypothetical protein